MTPRPASIPDVADVCTIRSSDAAPDAPATLLLEVPHGATRAAHFDALRAALAGDYPDDLRDFFFVNTDVGAPEVALRLAERVAAAPGGHVVTVIRCRVPRTFIDCNRVIDAPRAGTSAAGGVTPGIVEYVREAGDLALLHGRYAAYRTLVETAMDDVCGRGGRALMVHSYAPRAVAVDVDRDIVARLHAAYAPDVVGTWPLRPEVDFITKTPDGEVLADPALLAAARREIEGCGLGTADNGAYSLVPGSMAALHARRWPGRTLCLEIRRDLLVPEFTPFAEMVPEPGQVARVADALARAVLAA